MAAAVRGQTAASAADLIKYPLRLLRRVRRRDEDLYSDAASCDAGRHPLPRQAASIHRSDDAALMIAGSILFVMGSRSPSGQWNRVQRALRDARPDRRSAGRKEASLQQERASQSCSRHWREQARGGECAPGYKAS